MNQSSTTDTPQYNRIAKWLHWLMALLLVLMVMGGFLLEEVPKPYVGLVFMLHKSTGVTLLALALLRLLWRLLHRAPALPAATPCWQKLAAKAVHVALYAIMVGMPLSGYVMSSAAKKPYPLNYYGLVELPLLPLSEHPARATISGLAHEAHELLPWAFIALLLLHIAAALKHHYVLKDDVLRRMLP